MSQRSFEIVKEEMQKFDGKISRLNIKMGKLRRELQGTCDHPIERHSHRGSGATICEKCEKTVAFSFPKTPTAF